MKLDDIRKRKKEITEQIKLLRDEHRKLRADERAWKKVRRNNICNTPSCYRKTSPKTALAKLGTFYKQCDYHRGKR